MSSKSMVRFIFAAFCASLFASQVLAQGGWRQWEIKLLDGTSVQASPLQLKADGRFTRSMDPKEAGYSRSQIDYFASIWEKLPPAPTGKYKQDLIVMLDGKRSFGPITFANVKFSEGTVIQNGRNIDLRDVAYIKFAHSMRDELAKGRADRKAILAALRQHVKKTLQIDSIFVVNYLKLQKAWAWIETNPESPDGANKYEPISALLRKRSARWQIAEIACTEEGNPKCLGDDYFAGLMKRFPSVPKDIFPPR